MLLIILLCGDIEINPGPSSSISSIADSLDYLFANEKLDVQDLLTFTCLNVQSILPKIDIIEAELGDRDIILLTETWLKNITPNRLVELKNFKEPYRNDRAGDQVGGGVMIYVKNNIPSTRRQDLEVQTLECLWVEVFVKKTKILFGLFYRPPNSIASHWDHISYSVEKALNSGIDKIIVMGDFNENLLTQTQGKLNNILVQNGLYQAISEPTFFHEASSSLLDPLIINDKDFLLYSEVSENILEANIRYHCPISGILNLQKPNSKLIKRKIWDFNHGDFDQYRQDLDNTDWNNIVNENDLDTAVTLVTKTILDIADKNIPCKYIQIRQNDPPWMTSLIRKMIRKRKRLHKKAKKSNCQQDWNKFKKIRNQCVNVVKQAKLNYFDKQVNNLQNQDLSVKNWWKTLRNLCGLPSKTSEYPPLLINDTYIEDNMEKANAFNKYFCEQANIDDTNATLPVLPTLEDTPGLSQIHISQEEVLDQLSILNISKATGPDSISPRLLKCAAKELSYPLALLFNKSLQLCIYPSDWKIANVSPVFKNGLRELLSNYRPISLLSVVGKTMEKCIFKHFFNFLLRNKVITSLQSGFMPGDSTTNQLLSLSDTFGKALDAGKEIRVIFCDISRAFDRVWHEGLLYKLEKIGIRGNLLKWFKSYLSERRQRVVIAGYQSDTNEIRAGVPQGSILGPILFLIFINDIVCDISCNIRLFADDTSLFIVVEDEYTAANLLNEDVEKINQWSNQWLVNFNSKKTEVMTISKKVNKPHHPPIYMNNEILKEVEKHKHLGLIFQEDGCWISHVDVLIEKVTTRLNLMRKLKFKLHRNHLEIIYFSFIRPVLEYADIIWDNIPHYLKEKVESIQIEAARIVTGATKLCSKSKLYEDTGWDSLNERRKKHKIIKFHEMFHKNTPEYLSRLVPRQLFEVHEYNTRRTRDIEHINCRTTFYKNSFLPSVINEWNSLPGEIKFNPSKNILKFYLNSSNKKTPKYYNAGSRIGQILHARLRLNCSNLNEHLFSKNLTASKYCSCGKVENTRHFLLECKKYTNIRERTVATLGRNITLNTLLYGNDSLQFHENENIFKVVQTFIIDTGRFGL